MNSPAPISLIVVSAVAIAGCSVSKKSSETVFAPEPYAFVVPDDLPSYTYFDTEQMTVQGVLLGEKLFSDPILSKDDSVSCASCHDPEKQFADDRAFSEGVNGQTGDRNAPAIINPAWQKEFFWDGRAASLAEQALKPIANKKEMALPLEEMVAKLQASPDYPQLFSRAFGSATVTAERTANAIAQFEATLISSDSKNDQVKRGEAEFTPEELLGQEIFFSERAECFHCHSGKLWMDQDYHDVGLDPEPAEGRFKVTGREADRGKFKTPSLRNVALTGPWMHDGRFKTLREVVEHYNSGVQNSPNLDKLLQNGKKLGLTDAEVDALVAFLKTLSN